MKKRRFFALFLVLGLLVSLLSVPASAFEEIDVDARAALLVEKETGEILSRKERPREELPRKHHQADGGAAGVRGDRRGAALARPAHHGA